MKIDTLHLPRDLSKSTEEKLYLLRNRETLVDHELDDLVCWLQETPFEMIPSRAWLGKVAAELLRKHAEEQKSTLRKMCKKANDWQLYFLLLALIDEKETNDYRKQLQRAAASSEPTIQAFAEELLWDLEMSEGKNNRDNCK